MNRVGSDWALQLLLPRALYGCQETCPEPFQGEFPQQGFPCLLSHANGSQAGVPALIFAGFFYLVLK
jgi:hypothetical protein